MSKVRFGSISAVALLVASAGLAGAADVSAKKILIKDNTDTTKRQVLVLSKDVAVTYASADNPGQGGASVHVYGSTTTDDFCAILEPGANWKNLGTKWKYKNTTTKNVAQIKDGKLLMRIKQDSPVISYTLTDNAPPGQGAVNVQVQFGVGTRFCMRCGGTIVKDDGTKFLGKDCAAAACDTEPSSCDPPNPTTTTSTSTTSTSSTTCPPGPPATPTVLKGSLTATPGRFNYNLTLGLPGANNACNTNFPGTHACTYSELQAAEAACDLPGLVDTNAMTVTSFWAIDPAADALTARCADDATFPDPMDYVNHTWEYGTAHTPSKGQKVPLNNLTGALGALQTGQACALGGTAAWVGCCQ
jgi:hypothetical protein